MEANKLKPHLSSIVPYLMQEMLHTSLHTLAKLLSNILVTVL